MNIIGKAQIDDLYVQAMQSKRKRSHYLIHQSHKDKVQRLIIALVEGSYVEPHYHELDNQWEMFIVLEGSVCVRTYGPSGERLMERLFGVGHEASIIEVSPQEIHSIECVSANALIIEVKEGPFNPELAKVLVDEKVAKRR